MENVSAPMEHDFPLTLADGFTIPPRRILVSFCVPCTSREERLRCNVQAFRSFPLPLLQIRLQISSSFRERSILFLEYGLDLDADIL